MAKKISVVLLSWNAQAYLKPCIDSLLASIKTLDAEVIVVDNGSTDDSLAILEYYRTSGIQFIKNSRNFGVAKARNQALKLASGEFVLILDIDTVVNQQAILGLIHYMEKHIDVGLCACKLVSSGGEVQYSCRKYPSIRYKIVNLLASNNPNLKINKTQFYIDQIYKENPIEVDYVIGACQLIRRETLNDVGLLDEQIFYGPEDADFCLRVHQAEWKVVYIPTLRIIHHYQQITRSKWWSALSRKHLCALLYFFWKHKRI